MIADVVIVGAGAAGLSASIYASRRAMRTVVVTQDIGGQAATTEEIENYPGVGRIGGPELMGRMKAQAERHGATFASDSAERLDAVTLADGTDGFRVTSTLGQHDSRTLILAQGLTHRRLNVPGEKAFTGRGVSTCATCDAPRYRGKPVAVIGGGNSALDAAVLLAKFSPKVYLINRKERFNGEAVVIQQANAAKNIERIINAETKEIHGQDTVESIVIADAKNPKKTRALAVSGVFVEIGYEVNPKLIKGFVELDARQQVIVTSLGETSRPGVFAAGDITTSPYKQIIISAGEGAKAALQAYKYLQTQNRLKGTPFSTDWGFLKKE